MGELAQPGLQILLEQFEEAPLIVAGGRGTPSGSAPLDVLPDHLDGLVGIGRHDPAPSGTPNAFTISSRAANPHPNLPETIPPQISHKYV
jgi:hypothetical protein